MRPVIVIGKKDLPRWLPGRGRARRTRAPAHAKACGETPAFRRWETPLRALTVSTAGLDYSGFTLTILFVVGVLGFVVLTCCAWMTVVQLIRSFSE